MSHLLAPWYCTMGVSTRKKPKTNLRMNDTQNHTTERCSIWVIEDDSLYLEELSDLINDTEDLVCTQVFGDVDTVTQYINQLPPPELPHLVLMDINLPGISGIKGTDMLRARYKTLPIVMLTLNDEPDTILAALKAGASGYLLKGMPYDQLLAALYEALRGGMLMPQAVARRVLGHFNAMRPSRKHASHPVMRCGRRESTHRIR